MLAQVLEKIRPVSDEWINKARGHLDSLTKPRGSLGALEDIAARVVAIREEDPPAMGEKCVVIFAGDHDVVSEGISAYPQEVTGLMVRNFLNGGAAINVLARCAGARVSVIDIGMKHDIPELKGLIRKNVKRAAGNILRGPAMSREEAEAAIRVGMEAAFSASADGVAMIASGDMGIGNTTPSSAVMSVLLPAGAAHVTGTGTGIDAKGLSHKIKVIEEAIQRHREEMKDPVSTMAAVGGLEIAGICGLCLGGAARRMVVVVDGFISSAGALAAMRLNPAVKDYLFFSHRSFEKGHRIFFEKEGIRPILDLDLRLGEGTGAALAMQIIENALMIYRDMATFQEVGITPGA